MHLKADTGGRITIVDQHPVPQDAMDKVEWCTIEDNQVYRLSQEPFQRVTKLEP